MLRTLRHPIRPYLNDHYDLNAEVCIVFTIIHDQISRVKHRQLRKLQVNITLLTEDRRCRVCSNMSGNLLAY